jgi:hypothetical protein
MIKKYLFALTAIAALLSCNKSTDKVLPAIPARVNEQPLASYINADSSTIKLQVYDPQQKEVGYSFQATKKGRIYAMGIRMPQVGQDFKVTVWDSASRQIIKQKIITNNSGSGFSYIDLSSTSVNEEIDIDAGKTYVITVNTTALTAATANRQWYMLNKVGINSDFLPVTKGHIQIRAGMYSSAPAPTPLFPDKTNFSVFGLHLLFGLTDIGFYATEY